MRKKLTPESKKLSPAAKAFAKLEKRNARKYQLAVRAASIQYNAELYQTYDKYADARKIIHRKFHLALKKAREDFPHEAINSEE